MIVLFVDNVVCYQLFQSVYKKHRYPVLNITLNKFKPRLKAEEPPKARRLIKYGFLFLSIRQS